MRKLGFFGFIIQIALIIAWVWCTVRFVPCDFKAPYKAEAIYGIGIVTGLGGVIGYINIPDVPEQTENK